MHVTAHALQLHEKGKPKIRTEISQITPICEIYLALQNMYFSFMSIKSSIILDTPVILVKPFLQRYKISVVKNNLFYHFLPV